MACNYSWHILPLLRCWISRTLQPSFYMVSTHLCGYNRLTEEAIISAASLLSLLFTLNAPKAPEEDCMMVA